MPNSTEVRRNKLKTSHGLHPEVDNRKDTNDHMNETQRGTSLPFSGVLELLCFHSPQDRTTDHSTYVFTYMVHEHLLNLCHHYAPG